MDTFTEENSDDEKQIMKISWIRMKNMHTTDGFREGAIAGKEKQFQESFDEGYSFGFCKSYDLAYKSGKERILSFLIKKDSGSSATLKFQRSLNNLCIMCNHKCKD